MTFGCFKRKKDILKNTKVFDYVLKEEIEKRIFFFGKKSSKHFPTYSILFEKKKLQTLKTLSLFSDMFVQNYYTIFTITVFNKYNFFYVSIQIIVIFLNKWSHPSI